MPIPTIQTPADDGDSTVMVAVLMGVAYGVCAGTVIGYIMRGLLG